MSASSAHQWETGAGDATRPIPIVVEVHGRHRGAMTMWNKLTSWIKPWRIAGTVGVLLIAAGMYAIWHEVARVADEQAKSRAVECRNRAEDGKPPIGACEDIVIDVPRRGQRPVTPASPDPAKTAMR